MSFILSSREVSQTSMEMYRLMMHMLDWEIAQNRGYQTADVSQLFPEYKRAFFLKLPPGTAMHRHVDCGDCATDHIVMQTNPKCLNFWCDENGEHSVHMDEGCRYNVDRTVLHWAENNGETDRVHLLVEY